MELESFDHNTPAEIGEFKILLPSQASMKEANQNGKRRVMIKINKKAFSVSNKLRILLKKLPVDTGLSNFIKTELIIEDSVRFSFVNQELPLEDFSSNILVLYKLSKRIALLVESLLETSLLKVKVLKFLTKIVRKLCKIFHTYLYFIHESPDLGFKLSNFELEEFNSYNKRLQLKIDEQLSEPSFNILEDDKKEHIIKIPFKASTPHPSNLVHHPSKFKFERKEMGLSSELAKIREEAENLNFNDFENRKEHFKEELRVFESTIQDSIGGLLSSIPNNHGYNLDEFSYTKIDQTPLPKKQSLVISIANPNTSQNESQFFMAQFPNEDDSFMLENSARFIQLFWRFRQIKKQKTKLLQIDVKGTFSDLLLSKPLKNNFIHCKEPIFKFKSKLFSTEENDSSDSDQENIDQMAIDFERKIIDMRSKEPELKPLTENSIKLENFSHIPMKIPININYFIES
jgi:hypothetical protein